jgi:hypothetical protein
MASLGSQANADKCRLARAVSTAASECEERLGGNHDQRDNVASRVGMLGDRLGPWRSLRTAILQSRGVLRARRKKAWQSRARPPDATFSGGLLPARIGEQIKSHDRTLRILDVPWRSRQPIVRNKDAVSRLRDLCPIAAKSNRPS